METSNNGGSSDTDENEFAVKPIGAPASSSAVTTVTPVMNVPKASRSSRRFSNVMRVPPFSRRAAAQPTMSLVLH